MVRLLVRFVIWGLAAYGAKRLYDDYFGSPDEADSAGRPRPDVVERSQTRGAAADDEQSPPPDL